MTYPPTSPGYPAPQQPGGYPAQPAPPYPAYPAPPPGPSKAPAYLTAAAAVLGLAAYLASFGPLLSINTDIGPFGGAEFTASGLSYWTVAALVGALLAAVSLLPKVKTKVYPPVVAVASVLGVLLVIGQMINRPTGFAIGWALWLVLLFTFFQAIAAVGALLLEAGVLSAAPPRPSYGQFPPGGYYPGQPGQPGQPGLPPQRPGYPYGGYGPAPSGFGPGEADDSPSTPPAGFPAFNPAPPAASGQQPAEGRQPASPEPPSGPTSP